MHEADLAVVLGTSLQFISAHPTDAALIVEVSDTTVSYDRRRKGSLYARAGVADYWIINLVRGQLEVYRNPIPDASRPYGHRYASRTDLLPPAVVSPLALAGVSAWLITRASWQVSHSLLQLLSSQASRCVPMPNVPTRLPVA